MKNDLYVRWADFLSVVVFSNISADSRGLRMLILVILLWIYFLWGIERSGFFNGREKWAKGFENQRV